VSRFRFRLERLLGVRRIEEELARGEWIAAERAARLAEERVEMLRAAIGRAEHELARTLALPRLDPTAVLLGQSGLDAIRAHLPPALALAAKERAAAETRRAAWSERQTAVKSLENLRGRARETHRREEEARENALLDEQALFRAAAAERMSSSPAPASEAGDAGLQRSATTP
jgi:flagellar export protein FliJ